MRRRCNFFRFCTKQFFSVLNKEHFKFKTCHKKNLTWRQLLAVTRSILLASLQQLLFICQCQQQKNTEAALKPFVFSATLLSG